MAEPGCAARYWAAFAFTLLGWFLAVRIAIEFSDPIGKFLAWKISTRSGPTPLFPGHEYYTIAVIGIVSGAGGAFLTALGLSLIRQRGEAYGALLVRMVCFGALAGALLECIEKPSGKSPLHIDSALPLFLVWQTGIATIAAYHLPPRPGGSGSQPAAWREPIEQDIDRSAEAPKEQLLQTMAVTPNAQGPTSPEPTSGSRFGPPPHFPRRLARDSEAIMRRKLIIYCETCGSDTLTSAVDFILYHRLSFCSPDCRDDYRTADEQRAGQDRTVLRQGGLRCSPLTTGHRGGVEQPSG